MNQHALGIHRDDHGVVTLTLRQDRPVVVLDRALLESIDSAMDEITRDGTPNGFVLASDSRVFVAGADLKEIMALDDDALLDYLAFGQRVFGRISSLDCTSVAAINGAALGGGLEIAMHCDRLIGATPGDKAYLVGLVEAGLHICPGWGGANMLPARIDPAEAIRQTAMGRAMKVDAAFEAGLIEELTEPDRLLERAQESARSPRGDRTGVKHPRCVSDADVTNAVRDAVASVEADLPKTEAACGVVGLVRAGVEGTWEDGLRAERETLTRLRHTEQATAAIEAFFAKSAKA
ncbi:MAG: enoyl-CoA hydratase/isomerase family protein [Planctomycetota bacterium]